MANNNQQGQQLQIELTPEVAGGTYANLAIIAHSKTEFVCDFVAALPGPQKAQVKSRIILAPDHAKRLLHALADNINKYEQQFGKIELGGAPQQPQGDTANPFGAPSGQA